MRKRKSLLIGLLLVAFSLVLLPAQFTNAASKVALNKTKATLYVGYTTTLKVNKTSKKVTWSSNRSSVASVSSKGKVTAKKAGTAKITAKVSGKKYTCTVTVKNPYLNASKKTLIKGQSTTLKVNGTKKTVIFTSSNKTVASVTSKGVVKGKKTGTATITAKVGNKKYTCKVTVKTPAFTSNKLTVVVNTSKTLVIKNAGSNVTWESFDPEIATVNSKGKITSKKAGTTTIIATIYGYDYYCDVVVKAPTSAATTTMSLPLYNYELCSALYNDAETKYDEFEVIYNVKNVTSTDTTTTFTIPNASLTYLRKEIKSVIKTLLDSLNEEIEGYPKVVTIGYNSNFTNITINYTNDISSAELDLLNFLLLYYCDTYHYLCGSTTGNTTITCTNTTTNSVTTITSDDFMIYAEKMVNMIFTGL